MINLQRQESDRHLVYPPNSPQHQALATHSETPSATLVDVLALTNRTLESKLTQVLTQLEVVQIQVAQVKMLNLEEDRIVEVEETGVLKTDVERARLGPALVELVKNMDYFAAFVTNVSQDDMTSTLFAPYKLFDATRQFTMIHESELHRALDRWHGCLDTVCKALVMVLPENWKVSVIDTYDVDYVKSNVLVQSLITSLGSEYMSCSMWIASMKKISPLHVAFKSRHGTELQGFEEILADARDMAACVLAYNIMLNKFPKATPGDRRQQIKDLKKKLKAKLGKEYELPESVANRLTSAVTSK